MRLPRIPYWPLLFGPLLLGWAGFALNALVVTANGGQMPVFMPHCQLDAHDVEHVCTGASTHLRVLADWVLWPGVGYFSPGDFFLEAVDFLRYYPLVIWATLMIREHSQRG